MVGLTMCQAGKIGPWRVGTMDIGPDKPSRQTMAMNLILVCWFRLQLSRLASAQGTTSWVCLLPLPFQRMGFLLYILHPELASQPLGLVHRFWRLKRVTMFLNERFCFQANDTWKRYTQSRGPGGSAQALPPPPGQLWERPWGGGRKGRFTPSA